MTDKIPTWAIKQFGERFSLSQVSTVKTWSKLPIPINLNGDRYKLLVESDDGAMAYGVFVALAALAANLPRRGVLADDEGPLTTRRIASRINQPTERVARAIALLSDPEIGWLYQIGQPNLEPAPSALRERSEHAPSAPGDSLAIHSHSQAKQREDHPSRDEQGAGVAPAVNADAGAVSLPVGSDGMDGPDAARSILLRAGVNGPNAAKLVSVPVAAIQAEAERVMADKSIRNRGAVLAHRLADAHGIELEPRRKDQAPLSRTMQKTLARIEQARRNAGVQ